MKINKLINEMKQICVQFLETFFLYIELKNSSFIIKIKINVKNDLKK